VIGTRLPGPGAIYLSQTLNFKAPVKIGDKVVAEVEVIEIVEKGRRAKLACRCLVGETLVLEGEALVKVPQRPEGL
jgi:3-hydroxybutyryl-CoA dehydratase